MTYQGNRLSFISHIRHNPRGCAVLLLSPIFILSQCKRLNYWRISIHCLVALDVLRVFFRKKHVLVCNFAADYNLETMKTKSNINIKNEHCFVPQEIALAYCRHFCLLICNRQPIPGRRKMLCRARIVQQKCLSVHLPENNARIFSHFFSSMHPLAFKTVFFRFLLPIILKKKDSYSSVFWKEIYFWPVVQGWGYGWCGSDITLNPRSGRK